MTTSPAAGGWTDPGKLVKEAMSFFEAEEAPSATATTAEDAIRRAHQLVSPVLYVIEQLKSSGVEPNYPDLFKSQFEDKVGAVIFLAKHKLLDIEASTLQSRETDDARRDLSGLVEVLFRLQAVEALGVFYDFSAQKRDSNTPLLWKNVAGRCLYLLGLLKECRPRVMDFLDTRPIARHTLRDLTETTKESMAAVFRALLRDYDQYAAARTAAAPQPAPAAATTNGAPGYLKVLQQYEVAVPSGSASGYSSLLTAEDRIHEAAQQGDMGSLLTWIRDGSPSAMKTTLRQAMALMPINQYVHLLEKTLGEEDLDPVRLTVTVLELGAVNREVYGQGGTPVINAILHDVALWDVEALAGVAHVAVTELGRCQAVTELQDVVEKTPVLAVAEEVITVLSTVHRLPLAETLLNSRPELEPAYQRVRKHLVELQSLVESAIACQSDEMASIYLERLRDMNAVYELQQISALQLDSSPLARKYLAEIQPEKPIGLRRQHA